jgi:heavy metal sensor kinase
VRPLALKWRVSLLMAGTILLGMAFTGLAVYEEVRESLVDSMDGELQSMADGVATVLGNPPTDGAMESEVRAILGISTRREDASFRIWLDGSTADMLSSPTRPSGGPGLLASPVGWQPAPPPVGSSRFFDAGESDEPRRAVWMRSRLGSSTVNVAIALPSRGVYDVLDEVQDRLLIAGGSIVLITVVATTLLVGVGLRPIRSTARALGAVTARNVSIARLAAAATPAELEPFVRAVSDMLDRLAGVLAEQKRFVSDASHELRTPLSVARSTIDAALVKDRTRDQYCRALDELREDLDRMGAMIEDLLLMARLDEVPPARDAETFDIAELVEEVAAPFGAGPAVRRGSLALDLRPAGVRGDRAQVGRLLSNLLDNAFRHGPEGGTVSVSAGPAERDMVEVRVRDEGGRIPAEALAHLFDRFYRADRSRARATGGVGLGLSIAREIARRHGGDITVTSTPQDGTCFSVRLPAV